MLRQTAAHAFVLGTLSLTPAAQAAFVVFDHFDDGVLDPAWTVTFENASGWNAVESGTYLSVTDIQQVASGWNYGIIGQASFGIGGDFEAVMDFGWSNGINAMGVLQVELFDTADNLVASAGLRDAWALNTGGRIAWVAGNPFFSGFGTVPESGSAEVRIVRTAGSIAAYWNGGLMVSGTSSAAIAKVSIRFGTYENLDMPLSVDMISLVPEPACGALAAVGLLAVCGSRRFRG